MSALDDAKRFLWLWIDGSGSAFEQVDGPIDLLRRIVVELDGWRKQMLAPSERTRFESRIAELEAKLKQANERTREVEHSNVRLEEQLKGDRLFRRVQQLEADVKKANDRTRLVEHQLVLASKVGSRNKSL